MTLPPPPLSLSHAQSQLLQRKECCAQASRPRGLELRFCDAVEAIVSITAASLRCTVPPARFGAANHTHRFTGKLRLPKCCVRRGIPRLVKGLRRRSVLSASPPTSARVYDLRSAVFAQTVVVVDDHRHHFLSAAVDPLRCHLGEEEARPRHLKPSQSLEISRTKHRADGDIFDLTETLSSPFAIGKTPPLLTLEIPLLHLFLALVPRVDLLFRIHLRRQGLCS